MNALALDWLERRTAKPWSLFFAHKAVHPDAEQAADGTLRIGTTGGYVVADRHQGLYEGADFPAKPNMMPVDDIVRSKPVWAESLRLKATDEARSILEAIFSGEQEEIRLRARMMAAVDEGVGAILDLLQRKGMLDDTFIVFLSDNGYFLGEHGLGPERRFAYEEGIRSPFVVRFPKQVDAGTRRRELVICQDIAPTLVSLAGGTPGAQIQGRSLLPLFARAGSRTSPAWRESILCEYWAEQALPWLIGMTYKAVRTERYKYIHWINRDVAGELDELYDLSTDPYELENLSGARTMAPVREQLRGELRRLTVEALGL